MLHLYRRCYIFIVVSLEGVSLGSDDLVVVKTVRYFPNQSAYEVTRFPAARFIIKPHISVSVPAVCRPALKVNKTYPSIIRYPRLRL